MGTAAPGAGDAPVREAIARTLAGRPTCWQADTMADQGWCFEPGDLPEAAGRRPLEAWLGSGRTAADEADLATFADWIRTTVTTGCGVLVLRGLPVDPLDRDGAKAAFSRLLWALGTAVDQNVEGDDVHLVIERGGEGFTAGSRGRDALLYHTDQAAAPEPLLPELLLLWCLQPAIAGGETQLMSAHTVLARLLERRPELLPALLEPLPHGRADQHVSEAPPTVSPIVALAGDTVRMRYNDYFVREGAKSLGHDLTDEQRAVLEAFEAELADEQLVLELPLRSGDLLVVDNRVVMHNRRAYQDPPEDAGRRCLARGWVRLDPITTQPAAATAATPTRGAPDLGR
jgi:alpha-ketoglutarate-dependent taurine dioxygenase